MIDQKDLKITVGYRFIRITYIPANLVLERFYKEPDEYMKTKLEMLEMLTKIVDNL